jgi:hypothetical protein
MATSPGEPAEFSATKLVNHRLTDPIQWIACTVPRACECKCDTQILLFSRPVRPATALLKTPFFGRYCAVSAL